MKTLMSNLLACSMLVLAGCAGGASESSQASSSTNANDPSVRTSVEHDFRIVEVVDGLLHPWSMAFLPNGDMLVTELTGTGSREGVGSLRIVRDGELLPDPVPGVPEARTGGQGGLLDVVPHPDFESNRLLYISYSKANSDDSEGTTAVVRGRFENDELLDVEEIFEAEAWEAGRGHHGSRLAFDDEGYLYITIGDRQINPGGGEEAQREHPAQDLSLHHGTIVRLHDDGSVPEDNPFVDQDGALPSIWSYGHRNPQGLVIHPETQAVYAVEHGPQGGDELNLAKPGENYGWPVIGFGVNYGEGEPLHDKVNDPDLLKPVYHWTPSIAPGGLTYYNDDAFPEWNGSFFVGGLSNNYRELSRVVVDGDQFVSAERMLPGEYRIRDIRTGPDGYIYMATDDRGDELTPILRLEPVQ
ncbi:MAG: PQQ-dependent sugar dehydrogenase [Bacteroidota bacterium]